ncbi:MAG TPA: EI24 domain-containing protein [Vicinamibacteria bacterium]|nr:EI24 domain-containing protein [Vicinamibacteria bacterium]
MKHRTRLVRLAVALTSGVWYALSSFVYLLKRPSLWPLSLLPAVATVLLVSVGLAAGFWIGPALANGVIEGESLWVSAASVGARFAAVLGGAVAGLGVALLLTAPFQELLSRKVEHQLRGELVDPARGIRWEMIQALKGALYFLSRTPFVIVLGLVPIAGPPLALLWAAHSLAFQQTDSTLARHGLDFGNRRRWHRQHRIESIGFGLGGLATLLVPVANFLLMPVLVVGATRMALARLPRAEPSG